MSHIPNVPFKRMKATIALLQAAVLPVLATLDAKQLSREDTFLVAKALKAQAATREALQNNPTRKTLITWCAVWYKLNEEMHRLVAPELKDGLQKVLDGQAWVKALDLNLLLPEGVKS